MTVDQLLTSGQIARELDQHVQRVRYIIDSRRIRPVTRVGITRLFGPEAVESVRQAIRDIDQRRRQEVA